jgi:hypothetical protein
MSIALLFSDLLSIAFSEWLALIAWNLLGGDRTNFIHVLRFFPLIFAVLSSLYALRGLYPGIGLNRVIELKRLAMTTVFGYALILALLLLFRSVNSGSSGDFVIIGIFSFGLIPFSAGVFVITGILSFGLIPFSRWVMRGVLIYLKLWGEPVIIFGLGEESLQILDHLVRLLDVFRRLREVTPQNLQVRMPHQLLQCINIHLVAEARF